MFGAVFAQGTNSKQNTNEKDYPKKEVAKAAQSLQDRAARPPKRPRATFFDMPAMRLTCLSGRLGVTNANSKRRNQTDKTAKATPLQPEPHSGTRRTRHPEADREDTWKRVPPRAVRRLAGIPKNVAPEHVWPPTGRPWWAAQVSETAPPRN